MNDGWVILLGLIWYGGVSLWLWIYVNMIRSGEAGSSGVSVRRDKKPIQFWFHIAWTGVWLVLFATFPLIVLGIKR